MRTISARYYRHRGLSGRRTPLFLEGDALGAGLEGKVMRSRNGNYAIKIFDRRIASLELFEKAYKIKKMLEVPLRKHFRKSNFAWPLFLVTNNARNDRKMLLADVVGYGMPLLTGYLPISDVWSASSPVSANDYFRRADICAQIALLFAHAHEASVVIGDVKDDNIRIKFSNASKNNEDIVAVIDTDSLQIGVGDDALCTHAGTPEYCSPELIRTLEQNGGDFADIIRTVNCDLHAMATLLFKVMFGFHPCRTKPDYCKEVTDNIKLRHFPYVSGGDSAPRHAPVEAYHTMPWGIRQLFEKAFIKGRYMPAATWADVFHQYSAQAPQ